MKIIVDNKIPFIKNVLEPFADVVYKAGGEIGKNDVKDADALIIRTRTKCNKELLEGSKVKIISSATIGFDHIDTDYCDAVGIKWTNAPGCNSFAVKHWFLTALLSYAKQYGIELENRSLGIVGVGNVGSKVLEVAEILGMRVLLNDPPRQRIEGDCGFRTLDSLVRECDILTFHVPYNKSGEDITHHLVDEHLLSKINPGTIIVNSSRGEVIDNMVLLKAFKDNSNLHGAILDVWEHEPNVSLELLDKVAISTPHIAGYSFEGKANGTAMAVSEVSAHLGFPLTDWYPDEVSNTPREQITVDAAGKTFQQFLTEVVEMSYPIERDNDNLKTEPGKFEYLRGSYPIRRELTGWDVEIRNDVGEKYSIKLKQLGFNVTP